MAYSPTQKTNAYVDFLYNAVGIRRPTEEEVQAYADANPETDDAAVEGDQETTSLSTPDETTKTTVKKSGSGK